MFDLVPFRNNRRGLERRTDDPFNDLVSNFFSDAFNMMDTASFKTDVKENENEYIIESELPGLDKEDINIEISDNYLTISAKNEEINEEESEDYIRRERRTGSFQRCFRLKNVKEDEISASYENGILKVILPKKEKTRVSSRTIDIN